MDEKCLIHYASMLTSKVNTLAVDVVCRMSVDEKNAKFRSEHKGTQYYFCCAACKKSFDANPARYVRN